LVEKRVDESPYATTRRFARSKLRVARLKLGRGGKLIVRPRSVPNGYAVRHDKSDDGRAQMRSDMTFGARRVFTKPNIDELGVYGEALSVDSLHKPAVLQSEWPIGLLRR
jgi:hypothetical protein